MTNHKQNWIDLFNKLDELTRKPTQYIPHYAAHEIMNIMLNMDGETLAERQFASDIHVSHKTRNLKEDAK